MSFTQWADVYYPGHLKIINLEQKNWQRPKSAESQGKQANKNKNTEEENWKIFYSSFNLRTEISSRSCWILIVYGKLLNFGCLMCMFNNTAHSLDLMHCSLHIVRKNQWEYLWTSRNFSVLSEVHYTFKNWRGKWLIVRLEIDLFSQ